MGKSVVKHKIGWCSNCGYVHGRLIKKRVVDTGQALVTRPLCKECDDKLMKKRLVHCAFCGVTQGDNLRHYY